MDFIQCLVERCFVYATEDIRNGYVLVRKALQEKKYKKVIFIQHSQGAIDGGLMIDWLLADFPETLFQKLEVYTFASAANHFNNPIFAQPTGSGHQTNGPASGGSSSMSPKQRVIRHVEHYANTRDIVTQWGVLYFTQSPEHRQNRFIGQVFERNGAGHQFNQHYLDNIFPFDPATGRVAEKNEFMDTLVQVDDHIVRDREPRARRRREPEHRDNAGADADGTAEAVSSLEARSRDFRHKPVKELSRLWKYRNGQSPD